MTKEIGLYRDPRKTKPWIVRWYGFPDLVTGKQKRYSKSFLVKAEAKRFQRTLQGEFERGRPRDEAEERTLGDLCKFYLQVNKSQRSKTRKAHQNTVKHLLRFFPPETLLRRIDVPAARRFSGQIQPLRTAGREGKLSLWTTGKVLKSVKAMFNQALENRWIHSNPFAGINPPKAAPATWHILTASEYGRLLEKAATLQQKAVIALAYTAALRLGEIYSLTWDNIDFERSTLTIAKRAASEALPPFEPKSQRSGRTIPLARQTVEILLELHERAPEKLPYVALTERQFETLKKKWQRYRQAGREWENQDFANNVDRQFKKCVRRAGIKSTKRLSLHVLRKCACKNWLDNGVNPKVVQEFMGHVDIKTTMESYNRVGDGDMKKAAAVVEALLTQTDAHVTPAAANRTATSIFDYARQDSNL